MRKARKKIIRETREQMLSSICICSILFFVLNFNHTGKQISLLINLIDYRHLSFTERPMRYI